MFRKLVSNLSFSPGVTSQLGFYARRLRGEDLTRKLSMFFGVGLIAFQLLAVVNPATSVNADGPNDVFNGGFTTKEQLIQLLDNPANIGARSLYDHLGIKAAQIRAASAPKYIPARGNQKLSFGRHRQAASDTALTVNLLGDTFYARPLSSVATTDNARVIEGTTERGTYFAVLLSCGNPLVDSLPPTQTAPPPALPLVNLPSLGHLKLVPPSVLAIHLATGSPSVILAMVRPLMCLSRTLFRMVQPLLCRKGLGAQQSTATRTRNILDMVSYRMSFGPTKACPPGPRTTT